MGGAETLVCGRRINACPLRGVENSVERVGIQARISLKNILVATDFSAAARAALFYALPLARRYGSTLYLAHVVRRNESDGPGSALDQAWREGHRLTTDLLVAGQLRGILHKLLVTQGEIWEGLSAMIEEDSIDLVVVGTHGRTGLRKMLMGSVAEVIFRHSTCPVLTVGPRTAGEPLQDSGPRRILYATDFTPQSLQALAYALSLAHQNQASLSLLHVVQESSESRQYKGRLLEEAKERLRALVPAENSLPSEPELVVGFGTPATRILDVAAEKRPDLIVLGVRQPATLAGRRPWTTASEVTGRAACPVLTVRSPG